MRKFFIVAIAIIISTALFFRFTASHKSSSYDDDVKYLKSSKEDLSFEARLVLHEKEISEMGREIDQEYKEVMQLIVDGVFSQSLEMKKNNIELSELRKTKGELKKIDATAQKNYLTSLKKVEENHALTEAELQRIKELISKVNPNAGSELKSSIEFFSAYFEQAYKLKYTKLEIFEDFTGYEDPNTFKNHYYNPLLFNRPSQGLRAKEAVRKLKELSE